MIDLLWMVGGFALLYVGAEWLVRGGAALALRAGLTPLVVGLTVVAFGTSSPELLVSLQAAFAGSPSLAIGNVVGSNICNVALVLGLSALVRPIRIQAQLLRLDVPVVIGCSLLLVAFLGDGQLVRWEAALLVTGLVAYTTFNVWLARRESRAVQAEFDEAVPAPEGPWWKDALRTAGGLLLLAFGASWFVQGAVGLATLFGVSEAVIGLTVVAIGTSLPELATSVVAASRGEGDIAAGGVIGSNIFNILCILGLTALILPLSTGGVGATDLWVMTGLAAALLPLMRTGLYVNRVEGGALLVAYAGYLVYLIQQA